jgi:flagellar hook-associated protein 1 FlgK
MADLLSIGSSAANAFKNAIDVTSNNVANVATEGYNRQRAEIVSNATHALTSSYNGGGSRVESVERIYASYIQTQLVNSYSLKTRYDEQLSLAQQVEGVVASNDEGVQDFMKRIFDSFQELADNPTSSTARKLTVDQSKSLESLLGNMNSVLDETSEQVNKQLSNTVGEVNQRLESIHLLNQQIANLSHVNGQQPNDLMDQRDEAIKQLSQYMDIKTSPQADGKVNVATGDGRYSLIGDNTVTKLSAGLSEFTHDNRYEIYMNVNGEKRVISDHINGGEMGAVLDFRDNMLDKSKDELGVVINGLTASVNWQHYQGWDQNGEPGQSFYQPLDTNATASSKNKEIAGGGAEDGTNILVNFTPVYDPNAPVQGSNPPYSSTAVPPAADAQPVDYGTKQGFLDQALTEIGNFEAREYELRVNAAGNFDVFDYKTGAAVEDSAGAPVEITLGAPDNGIENVEGLRFDVRGINAVQPGEKFLVKPHQDMLENFKTELSNPEAIATRGQSPVETGTGNPVSPTSPPEPGAAGDNVNIANMASLQNKNLLYSDLTGQASETLLGGYSTMATNVGAYVSNTEIQQVAQNNVYGEMVARRESLSGVNLDEEAANLLRFQQAYQASAQILQTAQSTFQTLINAIG